RPRHRPRVRSRWLPCDGPARVDQGDDQFLSRLNMPISLVSTPGTLFRAFACYAFFYVAAEPVAGRSSPPPAAQEITRAGRQASAAGPADFFTGRVRIDPIWPADPHINASGSLVTFEPGA